MYIHTYKHANIRTLSVCGVGKFGLKTLIATRFSTLMKYNF